MLTQLVIADKFRQAWRKYLLTREWAAKQTADNYANTLRNRHDYTQRDIDDLKRMTAVAAGLGDNWRYPTYGLEMDNR